MTKLMPTIIAETKETQKILFIFEFKLPSKFSKIISSGNFQKLYLLVLVLFQILFFFYNNSKNLFLYHHKSNRNNNNRNKNNKNII